MRLFRRILRLVFGNQPNLWSLRAPEASLFFYFFTLPGSKKTAPPGAPAPAPGGSHTGIFQRVWQVQGLCAARPIQNDRWGSMRIDEDNWFKERLNKNSMGSYEIRRRSSVYWKKILPNICCNISLLPTGSRDTFDFTTFTVPEISMLGVRPLFGSAKSYTYDMIWYDLIWYDMSLSNMVPPKLLSWFV